jgi:hypothetical protein
VTCAPSRRCLARSDEMHDCKISFAVDFIRAGICPTNSAHDSSFHSLSPDISGGGSLYVIVVHSC